VLEVLNLMESLDLLCNCSSACEEKYYEVDISSSKWPAEQYQLLAAQTFISEAVQDDRITDTQATQIANNLLKLNVFFESKLIKSIEETQTYESVLGADFLNALGGALSLFLGISFILLFELVELVLDFVMNLINFCLKKPLGRKYHLL